MTRRWILLLCATLSCSHYSPGRKGQPPTGSGGSFQECPACPEMVVIPAGTFIMGSSAAEKSWAATHGGNLPSVADESPQHTVTIQSFAIGKYDVTRDEYAEFVRETRHADGDGCQTFAATNGFFDGTRPIKRTDASWRTPGFSQTGRDPVVCVSWNDAQAFVAWLNQKARATGRMSGDGSYRLPTESEWEYAARARSTTRFWWGDDDAAALHYAWYSANASSHTHPVGSNSPNAFGLYDMVGNVWQWTEDCYADNYANAPTDGRAHITDNSCLRVDRGGSWFYPLWLLRPAARERNPAGYRDVIMGFRVARSIGR